MPKKHFAENGPTPKERKWAKIIAEWRISSQAGTAFCRQRHLKDSTFRYWLKTLAEREKKREPARAKKQRAKASRTLSFVPARLVETPPTVGDFEIVLRGGRSLRVQGDFEPALLRKLVETLEVSE